MSLLSRAAILAADDIKVETVHVPEWGGEVQVKALTAAERDRYEQNVTRTNKQGQREFNALNSRTKLLVASVIDDKGNLLFSEDDVKTLSRKSAAAIERVFDAAMVLSGLKPGDIEEMAENFEHGQSDDSTSD